MAGSRARWLRWPGLAWKVLQVGGSIALIGCGSPESPHCVRSPAFVGALIGGGRHSEYLQLARSLEGAVARVTFELQGTPSRETCTAVVVDTQHALTAAHCTHGLSVLRTAVRIEGSVPSSSFETGATVVSREDRLDLLLLRIDTAVDASAILPVAERAPDVGGLVELAGVGIDEQGKVGERRFVVEEIVEVTDGFFVVDGFGASGACGGDSGGPLIVRDLDGSPAVAGILSRGSASCVSRDKYTRLHLSREWLRPLLPPRPRSPGCETVTRTGRCFDGLAVWCEDGRRMAELCVPPGACGWSSQFGGYRCLASLSEDPCRGVPDTGTCSGAIGQRCDDGVLRSQDCASCGALCGRLPASGKATCVSVAASADQ
jgi:hypothetical protein